MRENNTRFFHRVYKGWNEHNRSHKVFSSVLVTDCVGEAVFIQYYQTCQYYL